MASGLNFEEEGSKVVVGGGAIICWEINMREGVELHTGVRSSLCVLAADRQGPE